MEITNEFIASAFAAYWGCTIKTVDERNPEFDPNVGQLIELSNTGVTASCKAYNAESMIYEAKLHLHRLSDITDEHAIEVANIASVCSGWNGVILLGRQIIDDFNRYTKIFDVKDLNKITHIVDYLRSKGYATKFRGIDLIESGIAEYVK
jgi:hypothetical protein